MRKRQLRSGSGSEAAAVVKPILLGALLTLTISSTGHAVSPSEMRGKTFARHNCARCHSIDKVTESPLKIAPPFRILHKRYPIESLAEALAEGISTGHPTMPEFQLEPDQISDFIAFLRTLE